MNRILDDWCGGIHWDATDSAPATPRHRRLRSGPTGRSASSIARWCAACRSRSDECGRRPRGRSDVHTHRHLPLRDVVRPSVHRGRTDEALATAVNGTCHLAEAAGRGGCAAFRSPGQFSWLSSSTASDSRVRSHRTAHVAGCRKSRGVHRAETDLLGSCWTAVRRAAGVFRLLGPGELAHRFIPMLLRAARDGTTVSLLRGASGTLCTSTTWSTPACARRTSNCLRARYSISGAAKAGRPKRLSMPFVRRRADRSGSRKAPTPATPPTAHGLPIFPRRAPRSVGRRLDYFTPGSRRHCGA